MKNISNKKSQSRVLRGLFVGAFLMVFALPVFGHAEESPEAKRVIWYRPFVKSEAPAEPIKSKITEFDAARDNETGEEKIIDPGNPVADKLTQMPDPNASPSPSSDDICVDTCRDLSGRSRYTCLWKCYESISDIMRVNGDSKFE